MTQSNLQITLSNGIILNAVADSSSNPEQGYIVEQLILPLLTYGNAQQELDLLHQHCTLDERRINAECRYVIDLKAKKISFYEENYNMGRATFRKGLDLTGRYISYLKKITAPAERIAKKKLKGIPNQELVSRINGLPDYKLEDEGIELRRRCLLSNGSFLYEINGSHIVILRDEISDINNKS